MIAALDTPTNENTVPVVSDDREEPTVTLVDGTRDDYPNGRSRHSCPNFFILVHWRRWIRPLVILVYLILLVVVLPLCIYDLHRKDVPLHKEAWFVGGIFALLSLPISFWGILQHMVNYTQPELQRHIIRILWMVPIYALNAWLALRFPSSAIYLDVVRECYEAYVIYNFMSYLLNFLHSQHLDLALTIENKPRVKHLVPFCCLPIWPMGQQYIDRCRHGVLQYTVIRPAMTVTAVLCEMTNVYDEGNFNPTKAWMYITFINNVSQIWAMYCLIMFYRATKQELSPLKPVPKFICVKAVVFLSFWQAVFIAILADTGAIKDDTLNFGMKQLSAGIQDFLICIEMFIAAIAHYFSFSYLPYVDGTVEQVSFWASFMSMWNVSDVTEDVADHITYVSHHVRRTIRPKRPTQDETIPLLSSAGPTDYTHAVDTATPGQYALLEFPSHAQPLDAPERWECSLEVSNTQPSRDELFSSLSLNNFLEGSLSDCSETSSVLNRDAPTSEGLVIAVVSDDPINGDITPAPVPDTLCDTIDTKINS